jgi:prepilin-type N-terminal cleavage/methylation domain-containing protein
MKKTKKGFTLVELLVVIAILAVLTTVTIIGYSAYVDSANEAKVKAEVQQIATYISADLADNNNWEGLDRSNTDPAAWKNAFDKCDELNGFDGSVSFTITNSIVTVTYTIDAKSASATIN